MSCVDFRIIDWNYIFQSDVDLTPSSEDASFPVSNLRHYFRSKIWRTSGTFVIDTTNNKIDFKESGVGLELTATVASGTYTSTSLATAIKTAMEAAGAETYTISYNSGYWTIASAGSYLDVLFSTGTNSSTSIRDAIGFGNNDYTSATSYTGAVISIHTSEWVDIDLKSREPIDSLAILFDPTLTNVLSDAATLRIQASSTPNFLVSTPVDVTLTIDNITETVTYFWGTDQDYRYWRFTVVDTANPYLAIDIPKIFLGKKIGITRYPSVGFSYSLTDLSTSEFTSYGHKYVDEYPTRINAQFALNYFNNAQFELMWESFKRIGTKRPILIEIDPTEVLFDKGKMLIYGHYGQQFTFTHQFRDIMSQSIEIQEAF